MKRISKIIPGITLLLGVIAATLQLVLFASADERGLIPSGLPAETILIAVSLIFFAGLTAYALLSKNHDFRHLVSVPVQAVGCFAAAVCYLVLFLTAEEPVFLFSLFQITAAIAFLLLALYRLQAKKPPMVIFAAVCLSLMVLCFAQYRAWGQYTQLHTYFFPALSALFTALYSLEYGYIESQEHPLKLGFFLNQAALFASLVCLFSENWFYYLALSLWLISGLFTMPYQVKLPADVKRCISMLEKEGHTAYAVGGCVRDSFMGLQPQDFDLCTSATPEQICDVFHRYKLIRSGEKHGTIGVILDDIVYEITTCRTESGYADNRHPDRVTFVDKLEDDLARRDFTINAMAYHPKKGYIDPWGGQKDIMDRTLRTVGNAATRFQEDALRILRGVRFTCRFRLDVERDTMKAIKKHAPLLDNLARERVYSELTQILCHVQKGDLTRFAPVLLQVIPELKESVDFHQHSIHHAYDVFTHTEQVVAAVEPHPALRWAALLHDISKPQCFQKDEKGEGHFYGHAQSSAELAEEILLRLKASTALREQAVFLIAHHMDTIPEDIRQLTKKLSKYGADNLKKLIQFQMADEAGKGKKKVNLAYYDRLFKALEAAEKQASCLKVRDLAISGNDLMEIGYEAGPAMGKCQKYLLELVLDGNIPNEKEALLDQARKYRQED